MVRKKTADLHNKNVAYAIRLREWKKLIQDQEGVVQTHKDGSIATPIDPDDIKDANEYLEHLRQIKIAL